MFNMLKPNIRVATDAEPSNCSGAIPSFIAPRPLKLIDDDNDMCPPSSVNPTGGQRHAVAAANNAVSRRRAAARNVVTYSELAARRRMGMRIPPRGPRGGVRETARVPPTMRKRRRSTTQHTERKHLPKNQKSWDDSPETYGMWHGVAERGGGESLGIY
ncbi:hypothetical protein EMCRGX_G020914 [Ephydatia muelleri]